MSNLDSVLKSKDITLPTKVHIVKAFWSSLYSCMDNESWTIKKAEHQRTDAFFRTVVLEKTLESLLERKEIKQVNLKGNQS